MSKEKKQTPQQAFNQFLFEEMVARLADVKAYEKEVAIFGEQVSQHITDHEENEVELSKFYTGLVSRVEALEATLNSHAHTGLMQRITKLERVHKWESSGLVALSKVEAMDQNLAAHHERMNRHDTRISDLEETAESLSETVDQPSTCKCEAGNQMLKRIGELEEANAALWKGGTERDAGMLSLLKAIPDIEILKTQMNFCMKDLNGGMQPGDKISLNSRVMEIERNKADACTLSGKEGDRIRQRLLDLEKTTRTYDKIADVGLIARNASIAQAAAIETLQLQMKNLLPQLNGVCNKVIEMDKKPRKVK